MTFKDFIESLLPNSVKIDQRSVLLSPSSISLYSTAFTSESFDQENNYDFLRGIGEITLQQIIVQYIVEKYPLIFTPEKKAIVTDMKKFLVQGDFFVDYFKKLSPSQYIRAQSDPNDILSDRILLEVFQAFLGATERIFYKKIDIGYKICYDIVVNIMKQYPEISIDYEILVDPKTILKEMIDRKTSNLGYITSSESKIEILDENNQIIDSVFNIKVTRNNIVIGEGESREKIKAEKQASKNAIEFLKKINVFYELPYHYKILNKENVKSKRIVTRKENFYKLMKDIMQTGLEQEIILEEKDKNMFSDAFTHSSTDIINNYEVLETLGDNIVNKAVVQYLTKRFPQINCPSGKEILSKLKISLVNWKSYSELADQLGFLGHIHWSSRSDQLSNSKTTSARFAPINVGKLQEDVFESFFGTVSYITDAAFGIGQGYKTCYNILAKILDKKDISLKYEDIVDPKTIIKEIFDPDNIKKEIGTFEYVQKNLSDGSIIREIKLTDIQNKNYIIGQSKNFKSGADIKEALKNADMEAAISALKNLANKSIIHPNSKKFEKFC